MLHQLMSTKLNNSQLERTILMLYTELCLQFGHQITISSLVNLSEDAKDFVITSKDALYGFESLEPSTEGLLEFITDKIKSTTKIIGNKAKEAINNYLEQLKIVDINKVSDERLKQIFDKNPKLKVFSAKEHETIVKGFLGLINLLEQGTKAIALPGTKAHGVKDVYQSSNNHLLHFGDIKVEGVSDVERQLNDKDPGKRKAALEALKNGVITLTWSDAAKKYFKMARLKINPKMDFSKAPVGLFRKQRGADNPSFDLEWVDWEEIPAKPIKELGYTSREIIQKSFAILETAVDKVFGLQDYGVLEKKLEELEKSLNGSLTKSMTPELKEAMSLMVVRTCMMYHLAYMVICGQMYQYCNAYELAFMHYFK